MSAVHRCFLYDTLGFMTKERFEAVHAPLVNLIEDSYVRAKPAGLMPFSASLCSVLSLSVASVFSLRVQV